MTRFRDLCCGTHVVLCLVYADQEEQLCNEEVDAQVLVNGVSVSLQASQEAESGDADGQADQRNHNAYPGDDEQDELMHPPGILRKRDVNHKQYTSIKNLKTTSKLVEYVCPAEVSGISDWSEFLFFLFLYIF